ncbi:hypothetical protein HanRHA438_Chr04g0173341 [Helianthus annuus]|uniref:Uncharacterized protein n=1 Tax=Helianthus annuus TaxID=4232 RepID=A0A251UBQ8_HELAN|nr:uncharacterized protein LOC110868204 [Helianthus annuus]KAF5809942.1 hypothetical protein HanXRQr2_Chr04g0163381 [Helianthus annuus]KAJ0588597.1 hypothetical protein HanIR_Chr04g0176471 [Helianthus annuus]KAJ0926624.1 hypothetical protein HanRHA438_Chr04g0173341 [Helianthus annuus]KAJ0931100.1 hypothetical protein HanPSC8_Chr04g0157451 [Helianthus annuus]
MPTFTTIALQNLLEHRIPTKDSSSTLKPTNHEEDKEEEEEEQLKPTKRLNHIYISPALYTTPKPTPILDYPASGSVSPSPYVFNRKGRGGGKSANRRIDGFEVQSRGNGEDEVVESGLFNGGGESGNCLVAEEDDDDDFADPRCDSFSVASSNDSGRLGIESMSVVSNQIGEFYDATEDFSSEGSMLSCRGNIESELHTARANLLEEIEKRKAAEDDVAAMSTHLHTVSKILLSQTGVTSSSNESRPTRFDINAIKQFSEEVIVARFVAEAMGKAEARAEAELAAQVIIGSKDKDISRLQDRLQYYEAMIHEMSQNNLESMEVARRRREKKKGQRKWLWRCIGMSIAIGASVIAYSYAPHHHQSLETVNETQPDAA